MGFSSPSGRAVGASTTVSYNSATKVLSGTVTFPGQSVSGLTVNATVYTDTTGSTVLTTGTDTTDAGGYWEIDLSGSATINDVARRMRAAVLYTGSSSREITYTITFTTAVLSGDDTLRKATGGLNGSSEPAASLTRTSTAVSGINLTAPGSNFEPGGWQTVTTGTGGGSGMRGAIQANAAGALDPATFIVAGTDDFGVALSGGTGYTIDPPTTVITRYITKFLACIYFQQGATVNGEYLFQLGANVVTIQLLTGFYPRVDINGANATSGARMLANGAPLGAGVMRRILIAADTTRDANLGGLTVYLDDVNISNYNAVNGYVYNKAATGHANGRMNISNAAAGAVGIWGPAAGATQIAHGSVQMFYFAGGYPAIDAITGTATVPDITQQSIRNRFTPAGINLTNGSGGTGRVPQAFFLGQDMAAGTNRGFGGNFTAAGTFAL